MNPGRLSEHLFTDSIAYATFDRDSSGDPVMHTPKRMTARVETVSERVMDSNGNEQIAKHRMAVATPLPMDCLIWINEADTADKNKSLRPITIKGAKFPNGDQLWEVML